ncbi:MAG: hypothetical protein AAGE01_25105, partial [Pseudomonadota bacterium]
MILGALLLSVVLAENPLAGPGFPPTADRCAFDKAAGTWIEISYPFDGLVVPASWGLHGFARYLQAPGRVPVPSERFGLTIAWDSSLDGALGQGPILAHANPSLGQHGLIAKVIERDGSVFQRKEVRITVIPDDVFDSWTGVTVRPPRCAGMPDSSCLLSFAFQHRSVEAADRHRFSAGSVETGEPFEMHEAPVSLDSSDGCLQRSSVVFRVDPDDDIENGTVYFHWEREDAASTDGFRTVL